jgi:hypothetical protein
LSRTDYSIFAFEAVDESGFHLMYNKNMGKQNTKMSNTQILSVICFKAFVLRVLFLTLLIYQQVSAFLAPLSSSVVSFRVSRLRVPQSHHFTSLNLSNKQDFTDSERNYNDDAFGFVLLAGGALSQDIDFEGSFLVVSAIAAVSTSAGIIKPDSRYPAAVSIITLLISPVVASLRMGGAISPPIPVELGVCAISVVWAFYNWFQKE